MKSIIQNLLTARDNASFSLTKLIAIATVVTMLHNFIKHGSVDFTGLGVAITGIIGALAIKYHVEDKTND